MNDLGFELTINILLANSLYSSHIYIVCMRNHTTYDVQPSDHYIVTYRDIVNFISRCPLRSVAQTFSSYTIIMYYSLLIHSAT